MPRDSNSAQICENTRESPVLNDESATLTAELQARGTDAGTSNAQGPIFRKAPRALRSLAVVVFFICASRSGGSGTMLINLIDAANLNLCLLVRLFATDRLRPWLQQKRL